MALNNTFKQWGAASETSEPVSEKKKKDATKGLHAFFDKAEGRTEKKPKADKPKIAEKSFGSQIKTPFVTVEKTRAKIMDNPKALSSEKIAVKAIEDSLAADRALLASDSEQYAGALTGVARGLAADKEAGVINKLAPMEGKFHPAHTYSQAQQAGSLLRGITYTASDIEADKAEAKKGYEPKMASLATALTDLETKSQSLAEKTFTTREQNAFNKFVNNALYKKPGESMETIHGKLGTEQLKNEINVFGVNHTNWRNVLGNKAGIYNDKSNLTDAGRMAYNTVQHIASGKNADSYSVGALDPINLATAASLEGWNLTAPEKKSGINYVTKDYETATNYTFGTNKKGEAIKYDFQIDPETGTWRNMKEQRKSERAKIDYIVPKEQDNLETTVEADPEMKDLDPVIFNTLYEGKAGKHVDSKGNKTLVTEADIIKAAAANSIIPQTTIGHMIARATNPASPFYGNYPLTQDTVVTTGNDLHGTKLTGGHSTEYGTSTNGVSITPSLEADKKIIRNPNLQQINMDAIHSLSTVLDPEHAIVGQWVDNKRQLLPKLVGKKGQEEVVEANVAGYPNEEAINLYRGLMNPTTRDEALHSVWPGAVGTKIEYENGKRVETQLKPEEKKAADLNYAKLFTNQLDTFSKDPNSIARFVAEHFGLSGSDFKAKVLAHAHLDTPEKIAAAQANFDKIVPGVDQARQDALTIINSKSETLNRLKQAIAADKVKGIEPIIKLSNGKVSKSSNQQALELETSRLLQDKDYAQALRLINSKVYHSPTGKDIIKLAPQVSGGNSQFGGIVYTDSLVKNGVQPSVIWNQDQSVLGAYLAKKNAEREAARAAYLKRQEAKKAATTTTTTTKTQDQIDAEARDRAFLETAEGQAKIKKEAEIKKQMAEDAKQYNKFIKQ